MKKRPHTNFLYHYTSVDVLCKLFLGIKKGSFYFHASSVDFMNDSTEYMSASNQCKSFVDEIIMEFDLGMPFALCFSESENNIPMWNMYANNGKGVCLKFNYNKLVNYFNKWNKEKDTKKVFSYCIYHDMDYSCQNNKPFDIGEYPNSKISEKMMEEAFVKPTCFEHENEWRLMVWYGKRSIMGTNEIIHFKVKQEEICPYVEIPIPVDCIEEIILKPNAGERMLEVVKLLRAQYEESNGIQVSISDIPLKV